MDKEENVLCCDYCRETHLHVPIIEKPTRFGYKTKIIRLVQINEDGRAKANTCIRCLQEEIERLKGC